MSSLRAAALVFASVVSGALAQPTTLPADPQAAPCVHELLDRLRQTAGRTMISGQVDLHDANWLAKQTGHTPMILALDFMHTPRRMGGNTDDTATAIEWAKRGGIVSFQWHWVSPVGAKSLGSGFNTNDTTFDLAAALADPESEGYRGLLADIDDVAAELKTLGQAGVPVLFRPLHEAQGGWFWWGARGPDACQALYQLMFERITQVHGVHNVAWVWTVYPDNQNKGKAADWYPGNDLVDVVATDYLPTPQDYQALVQLTGGTKPAALAETMNPPLPEKAIAEGAPWAYWVGWARRDWNPRSAEDFRAALSSPLSVNLDEQPRRSPP